MAGKNTQEWHQDQVRQYAEEYPRYVDFAKVVEKILLDGCKIHVPLAIVQTRPKPVSSFAEKAVRKRSEYPDPVRDLTDLCGGRVITQTQEQVDLICEFVRDNFLVDEDMSQDVRVRLKESEFGYLSIHFIVQLDPAKTAGYATKVDLKRIGKRRAEIQVRTLLQHAWADIMHDRLYKGGFKVPRRFHRESAMLAASLENADSGFERFCDGVDTYAGDYAAYMDRKKMDAEMDALRLILKNEPKPGKRPGLALRIARIARADGDYRTVINTLKPFVAAKHKPDTVVRCAYGAALVFANRKQFTSAKYRQGQKLLAAVGRPDLEPNPDAGAIEKKSHSSRATALATLAWSYANMHEEARARELYAAALAFAPDNPYILVSVFQYEAFFSHDTDFMTNIRPYLQDAMAICRGHIQAGLELPAAYFTIARFYLLIGKTHESMAYYTRAIRFCNSSEIGIPDHIFDEERHFIRIINRKKPLSEEHQRIDQVLLLGKAAWLHQVTEREKCLPRPAESSARSRIGNRCTEYANTLGELRKQASDLKVLPGNIVLIAGGAKATENARIKGYEDALYTALKDFKGVVFSGGTRTGVPGLVGAVASKLNAAASKNFQVVAYLPKNLPRNISRDTRYDRIVKSKGITLSLLEPIQTWIDLLATGINPGEIRLLGISGGSIAAFEYRLALAMGAQVGLIAGSGREADAIFLDPDWADSSGLLALPHDRMTLQAFLDPVVAGWPEDALERAAQVVHNNYVKSNMRVHDDPALRPWGDTSESNKMSNRSQAAYAARIFGAIGHEVREIDPERGEVALRPRFTKADLEKLAEIEHGRWVAERLTTGWKFGPVRDYELKTSPYLVAWCHLTDEIKKKDRDAIRGLPEALAEAGLGVFKHRSRRTE